jgi:hypothetical protein
MMFLLFQFVPIKTHFEGRIILFLSVDSERLRGHDDTVEMDSQFIINPKSCLFDCLLINDTLRIEIENGTMISEYGAAGGMRIGRGNRETRRKPNPVPHFHQKSQIT